MVGPLYIDGDVFSDTVLSVSHTSSASVGSAPSPDAAKAADEELISRLACDKCREGSNDQATSSVTAMHQSDAAASAVL